MAFVKALGLGLGFRVFVKALKLSYHNTDKYMANKMLSGLRCLNLTPSLQNLVFGGSHWDRSILGQVVSAYRKSRLRASRADIVEIPPTLGSPVTH